MLSSLRLKSIRFTLLSKKIMFRFSGFADGMKIHFSNNIALASIIFGMGVWVASRCLLDILLKDWLSSFIGIGFSFILFWRAFNTAKDAAPRKNDLFLLPPTLVWATWMAHREVDFFQWWLPLVAMMAFVASFKIIFSVLLAGIVLIATVSMLSGHMGRTLESVGSAALIAASIGLHRKSVEKLEDNFDQRISDLQMVQDATQAWHIELGSDNHIVHMSRKLANDLGIASRFQGMLLSDIFHPGDYLSIDKARLKAVGPPDEEIDATAACDCRLVRKDGNILWTHAQFLRTSGEKSRLIIALKNIDERLRLENINRENQRKLAAQALEIAAQFDAAKSALHARQEVERLAQHDLRSPLKSIESAVALLRKGRTLSNTEEHLLTSIERTAARALSMVTMSLDLYRMEEGTFRFIPETIDLVVIGRNVIGELIRHARSKNVRLEFNASMGTLKAAGNNQLTTSIVENLVRNALEAAPEQSTVTMALYQGARVGLLIHNEGVVHESIRKDFFEKYATHGKHGGLGLGTYSARLIARAQGGDLTMTTSSERGTLLMLKLNRDNVEQRKDEDRLDPDAFGPSLPGNLVSIEISPKSDSKHAAIELLVVEDDDYNWMLLLSWLPSHVGARRAINGREAVEALTSRRPDIIIMDLEMPIMNGFEALTRIREMQNSAAEESSIIYAFTGYEDVETLEKIKSAGFDGILEKPVRQEKFDEVLKVISSKTEISRADNKVWIEKRFIEAFPTFIESRRALVNDIERSFEAGDTASMKRAAHTLAGSPAIHGFQDGILICRTLYDSRVIEDHQSIRHNVSLLRKILSNPTIR
jgi:signal transduction histidine kinase/CheY-like chemotaxis protein